jgi:Tfp pilus assembly protein PilO
MKFGLRETLFIVLLMAIPLGAWWFVFHPSNLRDAETRRQIDQKQARLQELNRVTATVGDLKKEIAILDEAVSSMESKLPSEKEIDKVLKEVWRLAEDNTLTTKSVRALPNARSTAGPHAEQSIEMRLEGDFMGLYAFLQQMEGLDRIMRVRSMKLRKMTKKDQEMIHADLVISIFFDKGGEARS